MASTAKRSRIDSETTSRDGLFSDTFASVLITAPRSREDEIGLSQQERYFRMMTDAMPQLVWSTDDEGNVRYCNKRWTEFTGLTAPKLLEGHWMDVVHEDDVARVASAWDEALAEGLEYETEFRLRRHDGEYLWHLSRAYPLRREDGSIARWIGTCTDVDQHKRTESMLREAETRLRKSEERFAVAETGSRVGIWDWDLLKNEVYYSPRYKEILGYSDEEYPNRVEVFSPRLHPEDRDRIFSAMATALDGKVPYYEQEFRLLHKDGRYRWILSRGVVFRDRQGVAVRMSGAHLDVTAAKAQAQELARSNSELQQFAHVASHDLREPLRMVTSYVRLLQRKYAGQLSPEADQYIEFAVQGASRMYSLIGDLLSFSKVGGQPEGFSPISMDEVLEEVLFSLRSEILGSDSQIEQTMLPTIEGDKFQLKLLWENLISNSIKFRQGPPRIKLGCISEGEFWRFSVSDNGIGIAPEYESKIFILFQRLHSHEEYPGTGMGLAICKKIVERHGGRIWMESTPEMGCTFYFTLPQIRSESAMHSLECPLDAVQDELNGDRSQNQAHQTSH